MKRYICALLALLLAPALAAQGVLTGQVFDAGGGDAYLDEPALVGAIALPATSPPFNEITATQWQGAFSAIFDPAQPSSPLGGALLNVEPTGSFTADVNGDGTFRLENLPLNTRLAVAVLIGKLWWPLREEVWFSDAAEQAVRVPYYRLGADPASLKIERWRLDASTSLRDDLRFAPITVLETIEIVNTDGALAAMVHLELDLLISPGLTARSLPGQYAAQFVYMQGWNAAAPVEKAFDETAQSAWTFGTGGGMHGQKPTYPAAAQASADNWHQLNVDPTLPMVGAGETTYRVNSAVGPRSATLVFDRPVPPAHNGLPGLLVIHIVHKGGVLTSSPSDKIAVERSFELPVLEASATISRHLTYAALVEGAHRALYGPHTMDDMQRYPQNPNVSPDLASNERVQLVFGFGEEAQRAMAEIEGAAEAPQAGPDRPEPKPQFDLSVLFKALAVVFGLAFVGALVGTIRKPRDKQVEKLGELPASREQLIEGVAALEREYKEGKLPARAYMEHRQRLLNRLVEYDSRP